MKDKNFKYGVWLIKVLGNAARYFVFTKNNLTIKLKKKELKIVLLVLKLHQNSLFCVLSDITVVDFFFKKVRFSIFYNLLSPIYNKRIFIAASLTALEKIDSVTDLYKAADWLEREAFDLFGIFFSGHKDLRRILTDYGFEGHPIRKDFPLSGFTELSYDAVTKKIVCKKIQFSQNFRFFSFIQWSGLLAKTKLKYKNDTLE